MVGYPFIYTIVEDVGGGGLIGGGGGGDVLSVTIICPALSTQLYNVDHELLNTPILTV